MKPGSLTVRRSGRSWEGRDTQKERLYRAEGLIEGYSRVEFPSIEAANRYVRKVTGSKWFVKHYGRRTIEVVQRREGSHAVAHWGGRAIRLPLSMLSRGVLLHEVAHCVTTYQGDPGHGPLYARELLRIVRHFLGPVAGRQLRAGYKANRVRYSVRSAEAKSVARRRGRALASSQTPEQRRANLDKARAVLAAKRAARLASLPPGAIIRRGRAFYPAPARAEWEPIAEGTSGTAVATGSLAGSH